MASQAIMANQRAAGGGKPSGPSMDNAKAIMDSFTYTGVMLQDIKWMDGNPYVLLTFETSGLLTVDGDYTGDVWMCGGGGGGASPTAMGNVYSAGSGGGGGYTSNHYGVPIISGEVTIGAAGQFWTFNSSGLTAGASQYASFSAAGGKNGAVAQTDSRPGGAGGSGGGGGCSIDATTSLINVLKAGGAGQGSTTRPFESQDMPPYCAGGGGGRILNLLNRSLYGGSGGSDGMAGSAASSSENSLGGHYGGGDGGSDFFNSLDPPTSGLRYGAGGGGQGMYNSNTTAWPGHGYPGAVMIRIPL